MNQPLKEIYEEYRDEMARTLAIEEIEPGRLADNTYFEFFARKVERLETLIELYAGLIALKRK